MPGMTAGELHHEVRQRCPETIRTVFSGNSEVVTNVTAVNEATIRP